MQRNLMISIVIDGVELKDLEELQEGLEDLLAEYPDKRINITIQDTPLVRFG